jgi:hypothetical protein
MSSRFFTNGFRNSPSRQDTDVEPPTTAIVWLVKNELALVGCFACWAKVAARYNGPVVDAALKKGLHRRYKVVDNVHYHAQIR